MKDLSFSILLALLLCSIKVSLASELQSPTLKESSNLEKACALIDSSNATVYTVTQEALILAEEAFAIAENAGNDSVKYEALRAMGYANGYLGYFNRSLDNMRSGLVYYETINDSCNMAKALSDIAYLLEYTSSDQKEIMTYNLKALSIREKLDDTKGIAYSLNNIGALLYKWDRKEEGLTYFLKAIPLFEALNLKEETAQASYNIGSYYITSADYGLAEENLNKALYLFRQIKHRIGESNVYIKKAALEFAQHNTQAALDFLEQARVLQELCGNNKGLVTYYYNTAHILFEEGLIEQAALNITKSEALALQLCLSDNLGSIFLLKSKIDYALGHYQEAYEHLLKGKVILDSLFSIEQFKQLEELHTKYETDKQMIENKELSIENKNHELSLKRNRYIIALGITGTIIIISFLLFYYKHKQSQAKILNLLTEQRLLRAQMNPHFIFNAISAIQNDILKNPPKDSVIYLSKFAALIRQFLDSTRRDWVEMDKEITMLQNYLVLQQLRYSYKFDFEIEVENSFETSNILIPPMLSQPFIENAIEHGIKQMKSGGLIQLRFCLKSPLIMVEIEDNGIGFGEVRDQQAQQHQSFAIGATKERLKIIHKNAKTRYTFEVINKSEKNRNEHGTLVRYSIPIIEEF